MKKEINKQPERSVEEKREEFATLFCHHQDGTPFEPKEKIVLSSEDLFAICDYFTQTLQAERQRCEEVVEAERERIKDWLIKNQKATPVLVPNSRGHHNIEQLVSVHEALQALTPTPLTNDKE